MSRYSNTTVKRSTPTKLRTKSVDKYSTTLYQSVPISDSDIFIITQEGDRLDLLAYQFYNDSSLWWYIGNANNMNTVNIPRGTSLRIPATIDFASGK